MKSKASLPGTTRGLLGAILLCLLGNTVASRAELAEFTVDPERSSITLSGTVIGFNLAAQKPGSLTAQYEGTLTTDLTPAGIVFLTNGIVTARNSGEYQPKVGGDAGSAPAAYGAQANALIAQAFAAARGIRIRAGSAEIPLANGQFDPSRILFQFLEGADSTFDFLVTGLLSDKGSISFSGFATNQLTSGATLVTTPTNQVLTIPFRASLFFEFLSPNDVKMDLNGQVVATRPLSTPTNTLDAYLATQFPGETNPAVVGPEADPDADGLPNFVEFAFGLSPKTADTSFAPLQPASLGDTSTRRVQFLRPTGLSGITYRVETASALGVWTALNVNPEVADAGGGRERVTYQDVAGTAGEILRVLRLTVSRP